MAFQESTAWALDSIASVYIQGFIFILLSDLAQGQKGLAASEILASRNKAWIQMAGHSALQGFLA